jgi:hypothetical protein
MLKNRSGRARWGKVIRKKWETKKLARSSTDESRQFFGFMLPQLSVYPDLPIE